MFDFDRADQALESLRKLHIGTDRDAEVATHIKRLLAKDDQRNLIPFAKRTPDLGETRGFMLTGEPGSGKSHLVKRTLRKLSVLQPREDGTPRCLQSSVPSRHPTHI